MAAFPPQAALVLVILGASVLLLVTEWIPMEVTALLVMASLALTGLVEAPEALDGFSNPAVITIWAVFILSGGLTRTGIGHLIGDRVLRMAGDRQTALLVIIMVCAGILSAFMNNVAVAALMLPVVMDICRRSGRAPSTLLMPLAYGSLLGGLTTMIGTPPNILVSAALRENGLKPFALFDFTPIGLTIMAAGVLFMATVGRRLLPARDLADESRRGRHRLDLRQQYDLSGRLFSAKVPAGSPLTGKRLGESRLGSALGFNVVAIERAGGRRLAPGPAERLQTGDRLIIEGDPERLQQLSLWRRLADGLEPVPAAASPAEGLVLVEAVPAEGSALLGRSLEETGFRRQFGATVIAIRRDGRPMLDRLQDRDLAAGDALLVEGDRASIDRLAASGEFAALRPITREEAVPTYGLGAQLLAARVADGSGMEGRTLADLRPGDALGLQVVAVRPDGGGLRVPDPRAPLAAGDTLLIEGRIDDLSVIEGLGGLQVERRLQADIQQLVSDSVGLVEAVLAPRAAAIGKTLRQLHFREKYGLNVLAVWRRGEVLKDNLRDLALDFGDALLLYGPLSKMKLLGQEPDFVVLTTAARQSARTGKAWLAAAVMAAALLPVILGWVPIYIAAVAGAAAMVLTGCLTMEEAYRHIEWKAVFLIAGMFPLGTALERSGAAQLIAAAVVGQLGAWGPSAVLAGLLVLTFAATCFIPTAALVVLMAPIVLDTCRQMGLSPHAFMMAVAMAASASFMTPISHPANILVMGPGGYRFRDYLTVGGLLTLVVLALLVLVLPWWWPLRP